MSDMRDWYWPNADTEPATATRDITWIDILSHWEAVELDLSEVHHLDVASGILDHRPWRWLSIRILDMVHRGPRLSAALKAATPNTQPEGGTSGA